jgi:hypothetical protein
MALNFRPVPASAWRRIPYGLSLWNAV